MKFIFIHGAGEIEKIFKKIAPELPGEHTYISLWNALGTKRIPGLNVVDFCQELIEKYDIHTNDIIIGHSLGGRLAQSESTLIWLNLSNATKTTPPIIFPIVAADWNLKYSDHPISSDTKNPEKTSMEPTMQW